MKAVMITFNQALTEKVDYALTNLKIKGYTKFPEVTGCGTNSGEPHLGTHTWPEINSAILAIVEDEKVEHLLGVVKKIDAINDEVGIRAFVWDILQTV